VVGWGFGLKISNAILAKYTIGFDIASPLIPARIDPDTRPGSGNARQICATEQFAMHQIAEHASCQMSIETVTGFTFDPSEPCVALCVFDEAEIFVTIQCIGKDVVFDAIMKDC